ncbi:MAG: sulfatase-like hydrolase/transferase [Acidobacteria bacterium]|nr:sulfatase-like hydrolase/transferase [Acidobacteriota bacterium]
MKRLTTLLLAVLAPGLMIYEGSRHRPAPTLAADQSTTARSTAGKPNIILIVADDLGYADLGVQGCRDVPTPNIDTIARNGVRFTSGYVSCPVCSPTRAGLMTGRYQQRFGHEFNPGPAAQASQDFGLPLSETTIAERLKKLGYATGMFGKWHLGYIPELTPLRQGFDEFFGFHAARIHTSTQMIARRTRSGGAQRRSPALATRPMSSLAKPSRSSSAISESPSSSICRLMPCTLHSKRSKNTARVSHPSAIRSARHTPPCFQRWMTVWAAFSANFVI